MAKDALVNDELAAKFATEKDSPYTRWVADEGLDIIAAHYVPDLQHGRAQAVGPPRRPGRVHQPRGDPHLERLLRLRDPGRRQARPAAPAVRGDGPRPGRPGLDQGVERRRRRGHLRVAGRARCSPSRSTPTTSTSTARARRRRASSRRRTCRPSSTSTTTSTSCSAPPKDFPNRFNGEPDYFAPKGEQKGLLLDTNFVADAVNLPLIEAKERGAGGGHIRFNMAKGSMNSHISQFPTATYKKGHRHGPGAHVIMLSGEGYSLMWPEGEEPRRYEWHAGTHDRPAEHVVPPALQHRDRAGPLPRLQARGRLRAQRAGRAQGLDQPAHRRRPDRLRRRVLARARDLPGGAVQARHGAEDGRRLRGGARALPPKPDETVAV